MVDWNKLRMHIIMPKPATEKILLRNLAYIANKVGTKEYFKKYSKDPN